MARQDLSAKIGSATIFILGILVLTIGINTQNGSAQPTQNTNLTGVWKADDGGTYYIRNISNDIWWLGISGNDDGNTFSNILKGYIHKNNTITAAWADIPRGTNEFYGTLTLSIDSNNMLHKVNETNYDKNGNPSCCFGATRWQR